MRITGLDEDQVNQVFTQACRGRNASIRTETLGDEVIVRLYPFRLSEVYYEASSDFIEIPVSADIPYKLKLTMDGAIPNESAVIDNFSADKAIIGMWMPIKNAGKKGSRHAGKQTCPGLSRAETKDLSGITMSISSLIFSDEGQTVFTFEPDARLYEPKGRRTGAERVTRALENSADLFGEKVRKHFEETGEYRLVASMTLDRVGVDFADAIELACFNAESA